MELINSIAHILICFCMISVSFIWLYLFLEINDFLRRIQEENKRIWYAMKHIQDPHKPMPKGDQKE